MSTRGRPLHPDILTPREWEVLSLIQQGASNDEIAQRLGVTERTAKYHVSEILSKLGVSSREEAVVAAGERRERAGVLQWALALKVAATVAAVGLLAGVAALAWVVVERGNDGEGDVSSSLALQDVYSLALSGATRPDELLHSTLDIQTRNPEGEGQLLFGEIWIDPATDSVRSENHPGPDWTDPESDGESLSISNGEFEYHENAPGDAYRSYVESQCPGTPSAVMRALLHATVVNAFETPPGLETSGPPTVAPQATAGQATRTTPPIQAPAPTPTPEQYDFKAITYLDPETFLPIAATYEYSYRDERGSVGYTIRYEHEFIDRSSVPADFFVSEVDRVRG